MAYDTLRDVFLAGYLELLPWFRSDGIHLLAHVRAARHAPAPVPARPSRPA